MSRYDDNFPPNRFLNRYVFKSPMRFSLYVIGMIAFIIIGSLYFPRHLAAGAFYVLYFWLPFSVCMMVWWIVWMIKNPPPKRHYQQCPTCHQMMEVVSDRFTGSQEEIAFPGDPDFQHPQWVDKDNSNE